MIEWPRVVFHALWILGSTLILAAFSHANWLAQARSSNAGLRQMLSAPAFQLPLSIGLSLISCSLFLISQGWLEHALWGIPIVIFGQQVWRLWRSSPPP